MPEHTSEAMERTPMGCRYLKRPRRSSANRPSWHRCSAIGVCLIAILPPLLPAATRAEEEELDAVNLRVIVNILKADPAYHDPETIEDEVKEMLKRASEILNKAKVTLTLSKIQDDKVGVTHGPGSGNADGDARIEPPPPSVQIGEAVTVQLRGQQELKGPRDPETGKRKRQADLKITLAKNVATESDDDAGWAKKGSPFIAIEWPHRGDIEAGETLAHELGHASGRLSDLSGQANKDRLMYEKARSESKMTVTDAEAKTINEGARKFSECSVKKGNSPNIRRQYGMGLDANPDPLAEGGDYAKYVTSISITNPDILDPSLDFQVTNSGLFELGQDYYFFLGVDADNDSITGTTAGPLEGMEHLVTIHVDAVGTATGSIHNYAFGTDTPFGVTLEQVVKYTDDFLGAADDPLDEEELLEAYDIQFSIDTALAQVAFSGDGGLFTILTSDQPNPADVILPADTFYDSYYQVDVTVGTPTILADVGSAAPGDSVQISGVNMPPDGVVLLTINDDLAGETTTNGIGEFSTSLFLTPTLFGDDNKGFDYIKALLPDGNITMTWIEAQVDVPAVSERGLVILAVLLLAAATILIVRRRVRSGSGV